MPHFVRPTTLDKSIARVVGRHSNPATEKTAEAITWMADEHVVCTAAALWWLYCRGRTAAERRASDHVLLTTIAASILPHLMKHYFTQARPDRLSIEAHLHGVPFSGSSLQSFPSGHAVQMGALASAAGQLPPLPRALAWGASAGLVLTRVYLLAHWASDVVVGLALGAALERLIRLFTGFGGDRAPKSTRRHQTRSTASAGSLTA